MDVIMHIDGGARGNPGPAGVGVVVQTADNGTYLFRKGFFLGTATNNVAEYTGLLRGLDLLATLELNGKVTVVSDSELMVKQINGEYRVKAGNLKPLYQQATAKLRGLPSWEMTHTRRENNKLADELANRAMDAAADVDLDDE